MFIRIPFTLVGALVLAACNPVAQIDEAQAQIKQFHAHYNDGKVDALYRMTGPSFRKVATPKQLEDLLAVTTLRLGKVESSKQVSFNTAINNGANLTTIVMETSFVKGPGRETFVFEGGGKDMTLAGWNVNSPQLVMTAEEARALSGQDEKSR